MVNLIIASLNGVAMLLFLAAGVYAYRFYRETHDIFDYWLILATGCFMAAAWTGFVTLEWLNFYSGAADQVEQTLLGSVAVVFALAAQATVSMYSAEAPDR